MTEQLSALADDEIALKDAEYLMAAMQPNSHSAELWSQYHLIGDVMRGTAALSPNFKQNLMQKIDLEPTVLSPNAGWLNQNKADKPSEEMHRKTPVTWSIAASFAAVMVVGWMVLQTQVGDTLTQVVVAEAVTTQQPAAITVSSAEQAVSEQAIPTEYLSAHQASAPTASSYYIQSASYSE
ncbi:MAG: sigma-E factor negative regulatory protein [Methylotenera sp.]|uniref:sigma-E factor negative regulatory protein n=1 Tax=Methylotenera sp. TaxID=2051956 RepID=UPI001813AABB|nr:sigma-E factor negative regulatory protein [Methylotenera sp.]NOU25916.1 sigma-E factor negative regulatory protein [Methylotenera sp.]